MKFPLGVPLLMVSFAWTVSHSSAADKRVLIIGIDGVGGSYLQAAMTPNLDALAAGGGARYDFLNEGALTPSPPESFGASGVNWSTILTGAAASSHSVVDNGFGGNNFSEYPSLFHFVKRRSSNLFTASIANWSPINDYIFDDEDTDLELGFEVGQLFQQDIEVKNAAINLLASEDPSAIFLHFDQVDGAGHGFSWGSPQYYAAIQTVDGLIGEIMSALNLRPGVVNGSEDWLVLVASDHGGAQGSYGHVASQGTSNWHVPFVASGPSVPDGVALPQGSLRDIATTALWHLGIDPFSTTVEGSVVGIPFGAPNGIAGDVNQDGVVLGDGTGTAANDDVTAFVDGWFSKGHTSVNEAYNHGDLNLDRVTDLRDWAILNRLSPAMARAAMKSLSGIPEPPSIGLGAFVLFATVVRPDRRISRT